MNIIPITKRKLLEKYFEQVAYEDYSFAENDGYVDHVAEVCKLCGVATDPPTKNNLLEHLKTRHQIEAETKA